MDGTNTEQGAPLGGSVEPTGSVPVDSRDYAFAYLIRRFSDVPRDFLPLEIDEDVMLGLFLPSPPPESFGKPAAPPHVLFIRGDSLVCVPHSAAGSPVRVISLQKIMELEQASLLLLSWVGVRGPEGVCRWRHNARDETKVREFWGELSARVLSPAMKLDGTARRSFGGPTEPRFEQAAGELLGAGEQVLLSFFLPSITRIGRRWRRAAPPSPADLLLVTAGQLAWITDRLHGRRQPYGTLCRQVPANLLTDVDIRGEDRADSLVLCFEGGLEWRIPVPEVIAPDAAGFIAACRRTLLLTRSATCRAGGHDRAPGNLPDASLAWPTGSARAARKSSKAPLAWSHGALSAWSASSRMKQVARPCRLWQKS